jgi:two-component sensor histidine kinase
MPSCDGPELCAVVWTTPTTNIDNGAALANELVTNSIKYAFGNGGGMIKVHVALTSNATNCISIEDKGKGMEIPPKRGLGLTLIEKLARQIQGTVE